MSCRLVIAEKPSVAQAIAAVLGAQEREDGYIRGKDWIVTWCVGHLVELAQAAVYEERFAKWRLEDLPILPERWRYAAAQGKKKQLDILRRLLNDKSVDIVICATDAGREGELIFRLVYDFCKCTKPVQRLWTSSWRTRHRDGFEAVPGRTTTAFTMPPSAAPKPIGWLESTQRGFFVLVRRNLERRAGADSHSGPAGGAGGRHRCLCKNALLHACSRPYGLHSFGRKDGGPCRRRCHPLCL